MNPDSGKIYEFKTDAELSAEQLNRRLHGKAPLMPLVSLPDPKCRKCYGRGYVGRNVVTGHFVPCRCTLREPLPADTPAATPP